MAEPTRQHDVEQPPVAAPGEAQAVADAPAAVGAGPLTAARIAALQRTAGNAAVSRMLGGGGRRPVAPSAAQVVSRASILDDIENAGGAAAERGVETAAGVADRGLESSGDGTAADAGGAAPNGAGTSAGLAADTGGAAANGAGPEADAALANGAGPKGVEQAAAGGAAPVATNGAAPAAAELAPAGGGAPAAATSGAGAVAGPGVEALALGAENAGSGPSPAAKTTSPGAAAGDATSPEGAAAAGPAPASGGATAVAAGGAAAPAAAPKIDKDPNADPAFQAMKGRSKTAAAGSKAHQPPRAGAAAAQAAAEPPSNDVQSQAQAAQVDEMSKKEPGKFDRAAFIAAVKEAIEKSAPKNLEEADDFKADGVKEEVSGQVKKGKEGSEKDIKDATVATPDSSKAKPKQVQPMTDEPVGKATPTVGASGAMPPPVPAAHTDLSAGPQAIDSKMAEAEVTDEQIQKSNEPDFKSALEQRDQAKEHSKQAPEAYRKDEQGVLAKAKGDAQALEGPGLQQMHGARGQALQQAAGSKQGAKSADEAKRAKVAADLQSIYEKTKADVTKTLDGLDGKVDSAFTDGEGQARKGFEDYVSKRMDAYKDERYSGLLGKGRWLKDKLMGMPEEVNAFYAEGKKQYLADMDGVIGRIADIVGADLTAARARIAQGKAEVAKYVQQLPEDLKKVGQEAEEKLSGQFEQLEADVESKQSEMVDTLASKYVEARDALDARIDELKAANRGLVDKALDAVVGVVKTIIQLKNMLLGVLAKAASVIGDIIADPIGFLGNLIDGIKSGLSRFVGNIATHLQQGLMGWLTGTLGNAGIEMPKSFDLKGIFSLVLQLLGLTYANIRGRVVKLVGEPVMARIEQTVDLFKVLMTEGVAGLWNFVKDKIGDLEDLVLGQIKEFIVEKVIKAGITWLIAFMNPAAAFIKACKMIYDIVMFIIERGAEIMSFVNSVLDSIAAVAKGNIGAMAERVEESLAKALPLAISFLASLLGLGGVADKVRSVIDKVRAPVTKAIDTVVMGAVKAAKKLFGKPAKWAKDKFEKGKQWATDKFQQGKDWARDKAQSVKDRVTGGGRDESPKDESPKDAEQDEGDSADVKAAVARDVSGRSISSADDAGALIRDLYAKYSPRGLKGIGIDPSADGTSAAVRVNASPTDTVANLPVNKTGLRGALTWAYRFAYNKGRTQLYVTYDGGKQYGDVIENEPDAPSKDHAEHVFMNRLPAFRKFIAQERAAGRISAPPGQRVPVKLTLNRLPCRSCAPTVASWGSDPDLAIEVSASTASNQETVETHIDAIQILLEGGVEVSNERIYEAVRDKIVAVLQAIGAKTVKPLTTNEEDELGMFVNLRLKANLRASADLQAMIDEARKRVAAKKALEDVEPVGAGVSTNP